ncbi:MAG: hypothetical protein IJA32_02000 [Lachnospiraceae bacterium]|nr:hypothetical protein [Lachnospiraceae bacterium]
MANICSCCGKKLPFLDVGFDMIEIDREDYYICSVCNSNFADYKKGNLSLDELVYDSTKPKLRQHFENHAPDGKVVEEIEQKKRQEEQRMQRKLTAQENEPLYDDIHQIAGDLRFIKNLIIFGLVCGVVLGIIGVLGML